MMVLCNAMSSLFPSLVGKDLRARGLNRTGNLLVPNGNYCKFEEWIMPILRKMAEDQEHSGMRWTPSRIIHRYVAILSTMLLVYSPTRLYNPID